MEFVTKQGPKKIRVKAVKKIEKLEPEPEPELSERVEDYTHLKEFVQKRREAENQKRVQWLDGFSAEIQRKAKEKYDALKEAHPVKLKVKRSSRERPVAAKQEEKAEEKPEVKGEAKPEEVETKPVAVSEPQAVPKFHVPKLHLGTPF